ncbi:MAG TPA: response regulator [Lentimicrobium sp.]|nr:response regulator [Lentimicrobium sp.]
MKSRKRSKLILLAEDDNTQRYLFSRAVNHLPLDVKLVTVDDGQELMDYLHDEYNEKPDLIFLDVNMPFKSGLECLQEIRQLELCQDTPVVIYTTSQEAADRQVAAEYRADLYLVKDGDMRSLMRILLLLLTNQSHALEKENKLFNQSYF